MWRTSTEGPGWRNWQTQRTQNRSSVFLFFPKLLVILRLALWRWTCNCCGKVATVGACQPKFSQSPFFCMKQPPVSPLLVRRLGQPFAPAQTSVWSASRNILRSLIPFSHPANPLANKKRISLLRDLTQSLREVSGVGFNGRGSQACSVDCRQHPRRAEAGKLGRSPLTHA